VVGVDLSDSYVKSLNDKTFKSPEPHVEDYLKASKNFRATTSTEEAIAHSDLLYLLVATPTGSGDKSYDHSSLSRVLFDLNKRKLANKHVVIGCTVLPGYIRDTGRFLLRDCVNTTLNYNPEFIAQGAIIYGFENPDMVLIGEENKAAGDRIEGLYHHCTKGKPYVARMSAESAELTKLSLNCFITTKIAFANTIADIAAKTPNADAVAILKAVGADSRVGAKCILPGYGFGGPCFPRDNRALGNYAKSVGVEPIIPFATDASNNFHAKAMTEAELAKGLDHYVFEDVCYKERCPVPIIEESAKLVVALQVRKAGKRVTIRDRQAVIAEVQKEFGALFDYEIV
jgi:UDPglucose 6-dehydrogenase